MAKSQRTTLVLLMLAGLVNFLDRSSLSVANGSIRTELGLSGTQMGLLLSAFSLTYGLAQLPIGPMLDRLGAQRLLGFGVGAWSLTELLTAGVMGMWTFMPLRILLGVSEAPFFPAAVKIVREQFPKEQRGRAMGGVNSSTVVGQALAPPLLTVLMLHFGWRWMFALMGIIGLVLSVVWFLLGERDRRLGVVAEEAGAHFSFDDWLGLFRLRSIWGLMLGFGGLNYTVWFYIAWLPDYLHRGRALSLSASGWLAAIPFIAGALGMLASGVSTDWQERKGIPLTTVHKRQIVVGMLVSAAATAAAANVHSSGAAIACISGALFFIHFAGTSGWGLLQAASPPEWLSTVASIQNAGSYVFASLSSAVTGWLLDKTHSFDIAFLLCAGGAIFGAACYVLIVRTPLGIASTRSS